MPSGQAPYRDTSPSIRFFDQNVIVSDLSLDLLPMFRLNAILGVRDRMFACRGSTFVRLSPDLDPFYICLLLLFHLIIQIFERDLTTTYNDLDVFVVIT